MNRKLTRRQYSHGDSNRGAVEYTPRSDLTASQESPERAGGQLRQSAVDSEIEQWRVRKTRRSPGAIQNEEKRADSQKGPGEGGRETEREDDEPMKEQNGPRGEPTIDSRQKETSLTTRYYAGVFLSLLSGLL